MLLISLEEKHGALWMEGLYIAVGYDVVTTGDSSTRIHFGHGALATFF
jgi:hypothetical protein